LAENGHKIPTMSTPAMIASKARLNLKSNSTAVRVPVQATIKGSGTPTNKASLKTLKERHTAQPGHDPFDKE
jgi:hypothetical protein